MTQCVTRLIPVICCTCSVNAHMQVHALNAVCRMHLAPNTPSGLTPLGTAAELVGLSAPGSAVHLLGMAHLVAAAGDAWGARDVRVEGTLQALMNVSWVGPWL